VKGGDSLRLFCALRLSDDVVDAIAGWQRSITLPLGVRIVPSSNLHVTLVFLGSRPAKELATVVAALRRRAGGIGRPTFAVARYRETRSVGMLVLADDARATELARGLQLDLLHRVERDRWLPHVTVFRFRERPRLRNEPPDLGAFSPSEAAVYHSVLRPTGAQYEVLETVALGG
jgi:RNA 2',3'-cyclic 3'-phosphodiesterase